MKSVLIIDDSISIRNVVKMILTEAGYNVFTAIDGQDALEKLGGHKLHLIICDVNMPRMDGITFLSELKTNAKYAEHKFTPVIMLTTEGSEDKKLMGQQAGAKAWVVKPFVADQLLLAVKKLILPDE